MSRCVSSAAPLVQPQISEFPDLEKVLKYLHNCLGNTFECKTVGYKEPTISGTLYYARLSFFLWHTECRVTIDSEHRHYLGAFHEDNTEELFRLINKLQDQVKMITVDLGFSDMAEKLAYGSGNPENEGQAEIYLCEEIAKALGIKEDTFDYSAPSKEYPLCELTTGVLFSRENQEAEVALTRFVDNNTARVMAGKETRLTLGL